MRFSSSYAYNQHSCDSSRSDITHSAHDIAETRGTTSMCAKSRRGGATRECRSPNSAEPERARSVGARGPRTRGSRNHPPWRAGSHGSWRCEQAASGGGRPASCGSIGRSSTRKEGHSDLRKGRETDTVSPATRKSRAARLHTSPSKDIGCCSCAELAMPEEQRSYQHSTESAHVVRIKVRGRASGVRRVARASGVRTAAAHPRSAQSSAPSAPSSPSTSETAP